MFIQSLQKAISRGGVSVLPPTELKDENGSVWVATVKTYGDTHHTLIQRNGYTGVFLPGFIPHFLKNTMNNYVKPINFEKIDHIVGNQPVILISFKLLGLTNERRCWFVRKTLGLPLVLVSRWLHYAHRLFRFEVNSYDRLWWSYQNAHQRTCERQEKVSNLRIRWLLRRSGSLTHSLENW